MAWIGLAAAIVTWPPAQAAAEEDLGVAFKLAASDRCSKTSPEITVTNVPPGAVSFKVRLRDLDKPSWRHGGGMVPADPSGKIAQGALTNGYNGPCPPSGSHRYEFIVEALDANEDTLAEGSATQSFP